MAQRGSWASYVIWGSFAVCAVLGAAVTITLVVGAHRGMQFALPGIGALPPRAASEAVQAKAPASAPAPATVATNHEITRLNEALRALAAERDQLAERLTQIERTVGDITASIKQPPARIAEPATSSSAASSGDVPANADRAERIAAAPVEVSPPVRTPAQRAGAITSSAPGPASPDSSEIFRPYALMQPLITPPSPTQAPMQIHAIPLVPEPATRPPETISRATDNAAIRTEFAVDLGGDSTMDGLRTLWANLRGTHGAALASLWPLVSIQEGGKPGRTELRLIAGPLANAGAAARTCASLQAKGVSCQTTVFDGQRLALR